MWYGLFLPLPSLLPILLQSNWTNVLRLQGTAEKTSPLRVCKQGGCTKICLCVRQGFVSSVCFDCGAWKATHACPVAGFSSTNTIRGLGFSVCTKRESTGWKLIPELCPQTAVSSRGAASPRLRSCKATVRGFFVHFSVLHISVFPWFISLR